MTDQVEYRKNLQNCRETRRFNVTVDEFAQRGEGKDKEYNFRGLASRTETYYEVFDYLGSFQEMIKAEAFKSTLTENPDVSLLIMHEGLPLASTKSGTLRLWESERGLEVEAELDMMNPMTQQVASGVSRGDITEMSFGFRVVRQVWNEDYTEREIEIVNLHRGDVSIVDRGANPYTDIDRDHLPYSEDEDDDERKSAMMKQQLQEEALLLQA